MSAQDWNAHYASGQLPWDAGAPDEYLVSLVGAKRLPAGRALDIGSGTGTNTIWLAQQGYDALGIDIAPLAVEGAQRKAESANTACRFMVLDFLTQDVPGAPFDLIFDRGCFHVFDDPQQQAQFAQRVAGTLAPGGVWLSLIGSTEGPARDHGPPRRSMRDIANAIEPVLELRELRDIMFDAQLPTAARAWLCITGHRQVPAQPSSSRG